MWWTAGTSALSAASVSSHQAFCSVMATTLIAWRWRAGVRIEHAARGIGCVPPSLCPVQDKQEHGDGEAADATR
jgi:hypothetical protein